MHYLSWIENLPAELVIGTAAVLVLLLIWIWANYGRRHYLVIKKSDATQLIVRELGRIADSLERLERMPRQQPTLALAPEPPIVQELATVHEAPAAGEPATKHEAPVAAQSPVVQETPSRHVSLSMFGR